MRCVQYVEQRDLSLLFPEYNGVQVQLQPLFLMSDRIFPSRETVQEQNDNDTEYAEAVEAAAEAAAAAAEDEAILGDMRAVSDSETAEKMAEYIEQIKVHIRSKRIFTERLK